MNKKEMLKDIIGEEINKNNIGYVGRLTEFHKGKNQKRQEVINKAKEWGIKIR